MCWLRRVVCARRERGQRPSLATLLELLGEIGELLEADVERSGHPPDRPPSRVVPAVLDPGDPARMKLRPLSEGVLCQVGFETKAPDRPPEPPLGIFAPCHAAEQKPWKPVVL